VAVLSANRKRPALRSGAVVVYSGSEVIAGGLVGLLPRAWRDQVATVTDLGELDRALALPRTDAIIDGDAAGAGDAVRMTRARGGTAILVLSSRSAHPPEVLDEADAVVHRDEAEPLTLRVALAAGKVGMRLLPRSWPTSGATGADAQPVLLETPRQVLALLAAGMRDAEIARELNLSESAVRKLVQRTVRSVGARTRCQAVAIAARIGGLSDDGDRGEPLADRALERVHSQSLPAEPQIRSPSARA
jgi:DNA-binding NarL/FixJ family response regulator